MKSLKLNLQSNKHLQIWNLSSWLKFVTSKIKIWFLEITSNRLSFCLMKTIFSFSSKSLISLWMSWIKRKFTKMKFLRLSKLKSQKSSFCFRMRIKLRLFSTNLSTITISIFKILWIKGKRGKWLDKICRKNNGQKCGKKR